MSFSISFISGTDGSQGSGFISLRIFSISADVGFHDFILFRCRFKLGGDFSLAVIISPTSSWYVHEPMIWPHQHGWPQRQSCDSPDIDRP